MLQNFRPLDTKIVITVKVDQMSAVERALMVRTVLNASWPPSEMTF